MQYIYFNDSSDDLPAANEYSDCSVLGNYNGSSYKISIAKEKQNIGS